ncbi:MFS transporter [Ornithinicoccus halotolerans]|uniref:MFS transporter n=1 Tax=Ornithinicoccus halotolerans TaxID=1748220 RepID=UPI001295C4B0|nr:MFS transporter [Ornithinicoccus halotolerans]
MAEIAPPTPAADTAAPSSWWRRRPAAWRHRGFRQLTRAWVLTNLADSALFLMVAVWVKELTGSDSAAALVFVMLGLPALVAPLLGQLADRVRSRRRLLAATNGGIALVSLSLVLVTSPGWLWLLYAVVLAYGCVGYLTAATQTGLVRDLLPDEDLASGNGVLTTVDQSLRLLSPLLGTALYVAAGPRAVVLLTVACFGAGGLLLLRLALVESPPEDAAARGSYWQEISAGVRHLRATTPLGRMTVLLAVAFGATGMSNAVVFPALEQGLEVPAATLGPLVSVQGVGAIVAGLTAAWAIGRWGEGRAFAAGLLLLGLGLVPVALSSLPALAVGLAAVGFGVTWTVVAFTTARQRLTPPRLQGRTGAASSVAINLPQTAMTAGAAAMLAVVDYRALVAVTVLCVLASAAAAVLPGPDRAAPVTESAGRTA